MVFFQIYKAGALFTGAVVGLGNFLIMLHDNTSLIGHKALFNHKGLPNKGLLNPKKDPELDFIIYGTAVSIGKGILYGASWPVLMPPTAIMMCLVNYPARDWITGRVVIKAGFRPHFIVFANGRLDYLKKDSTEDVD